MQHNKLISVIIPTYNSGLYIEQAIDSVLSQSYQNIEVIVIDDGSTDDTKDRMHKYGNRIIYKIIEHFGTPGNTRNVGISYSHGEYIAFLDSDDYMLAGHIERAIDILNKYAEVDVLFTNFKMLSDSSIESSWFEKPHVIKQLILLEGEQIEHDVLLFRKNLYMYLLENNVITPSTVVLRKSILMKTGYFNQHLVGGEDRDLWLRICKAGGRYAYVNAPRVIYRRHQKSVTQNPKTALCYIKLFTLLLDENRGNKPAERIIKSMLSLRHFQYGLCMKNERKYSNALKHYSLSILNAGYNVKIIATTLLAMLKIPIFMVIDIARGEHYKVREV